MTAPQRRRSQERHHGDFTGMLAVPSTLTRHGAFQYYLFGFRQRSAARPARTWFSLEFVQPKWTNLVQKYLVGTQEGRDGQRGVRLRRFFSLFRA
jgi:hypothetical protein